jgi:hypothetical protein
MCGRGGAWRLLAFLMHATQLRDLLVFLVEHKISSLNNSLTFSASAFTDMMTCILHAFEADMCVEVHVYALQGIRSLARYLEEKPWKKKLLVRRRLLVFAHRSFTDGRVIAGVYDPREEQIAWSATP